MTVRVRYRDFIWIEDLVDLIEQCGSSPLYSLLKREDEKYVTEQAYGEITRRIVEAADRHAAGRVLSLLEGGYDMEGLAASVDEHLRALA